MRLLPQSLKKITPKGKGIIQNSITGIGTAAVLQTVDSFIGAPLQRFGIVIPFLGIRVSLIDGINYFIHANGLKVSKNGFIAVGASKFIQGSLSLGGISALSATASSPGAPGASAGIGGGGL